MGLGNLFPNGIRSPNAPARRESLYRLLHILISIPMRKCKKQISGMQKLYSRIACDCRILFWNLWKNDSVRLDKSKYGVSQEEWTKLRESVPYVELYRYNPKHLYPKLNGYGDNGQRILKLWQMLHTYWLPNTYQNWQEYVVSVMLISVLNIKRTCEWHKAIKLNYKNTRTTVVFVLRFPSNLRRPQLFRYLAKVTALRC